MALQGRTPTKDEKKWMSESCDYVGCVVCRIFNGVKTEASPHHIDGKTKKGAHRKTIPLCGRHHQIPDTTKPKMWVSRHGDGKAAFEEEYAGEEWLLDATEQLLNKEKELREI